jgi:hypothetical protein
VIAFLQNKSSVLFVLRVGGGVVVICAMCFGDPKKEEN